MTRTPSKEVSAALALIGTLGADGKPRTKYAVSKLTGVNQSTLSRAHKRHREDAYKRALSEGYVP